MNNEFNRMQAAQWILERNLGWIAAAEIKIGVVVTLQLAMMGCLAAAFSTAEPASRTAWAYLATLTTAGASVIAFVCAAVVIRPRQKGPEESLLFFGRIAALDLDDYQKQLANVTEQALLADLTAQIHRNAEIARDKHLNVSRAMGWSVFTALSWIAAIGLLVRY